MVTMTLDLIFFLILSLIAIATAIGMLAGRNAIYSALFLVLNFTTVAVFTNSPQGIVGGT